MEQRDCDCGRVTRDQSLTISLAGLLDGYVVKHSELQISAKRNTVIKAEATFGQSVQSRS